MGDTSLVDLVQPAAVGLYIGAYGTIHGPTPGTADSGTYTKRKEMLKKLDTSKGRLYKDDSKFSGLR
ncbi:hypothetical protein ACFX11_039167 [Malus domestica]